MIDTIVYNSKTGFSKEYAEIISKKLNCNMYSIKEAKKKLLKNSEIIYISSISATRIRKLAKVSRIFDVKYVLAVGMLDYDEDYESKIFANNFQINNKLYYLPGGLNYKKLNLINKCLINIMKKYYKMLEKTAKKQNKQLMPKDKSVLSMLESGYINKVSEENLNKFFDEFVS